MGLLEKLRGELVDIVEWIDHTRDTLVWRFPRYHNQIKNGAALIVRPRPDGGVRTSRRTGRCLRAGQL